jgi:two-component system phosphate regulon response regulator PhoB
MLLSMRTAESQKQILIVDRDVAGAEPLRELLELAGFAVQLMSDGAGAVAALGERPPQLIIVDWNVAGLAGIDLLECARALKFAQPVRLIILSEPAGEQDIVAGLNMGADDYIRKPYSLREAVARIQAVLRARVHDGNHALSFERLTLNTATNRVTVHGVPLYLRGAEYRLLAFLMSHPGRTFNRAQLLAQVWAGDAGIDERTVDVNVQRLRKMLAETGYDACIQTVRGFGYRFIER